MVLGYKIGWSRCCMRPTSNNHDAAYLYSFSLQFLSFTTYCNYTYPTNHGAYQGTRYNSVTVVLYGMYYLH